MDYQNHPAPDPLATLRVIDHQVLALRRNGRNVSVGSGSPSNVDVKFPSHAVGNVPVSHPNLFGPVRQRWYRLQPPTPDLKNRQNQK